MITIVVGASTGLGRALAEKFCGNGDTILLVSSSVDDLKHLASHLKITTSAHIEYLAADAAHPEKFSELILEKSLFYKEVNCILFPIGLSVDHDALDVNYSDTLNIININFLCITRTIAKLIPILRKSKNPTIIGISSIASERGRGTNIIYSASKRALNSYFESLRHALVKDKIIVQLYILGYLQSQLSYGKKLLFPALLPHAAAQIVSHNLKKDFGVKYLPSYWRWISIVIRFIPWTIFKKLNF